MATRYNTSAIKKYILEVAGNSPKYQSFLSAQNLILDSAQQKKKSLIELLREKHNARLRAYELYWSMYYGSHWYQYGTDQTKPTPKYFNYSAIEVNKHMSWLMNKGFLVESDFPEIEQFLQNNWKLNLGGVKELNQFGLQMSLNGGVTGDVWYDLYFDEHPLTGEEYIKLNMLEGHKCFPVLDSGNLIGFLYYSLEEYVKAENHGFPEYDIRYEGFYLRAGKKEVIVDDEVRETVDYDFTNLPLIHIQNFPTPLSYYGISDLANVVDMNIMFDKLLTNISDIVDYHSAPITILKGAKANDLVRAANRVWILSNPDATIENLKLEGELVAANTLLDKVTKLMTQSGKTPETAMGMDKGLSHSTGVSLVTTFMPLYEAMEVKRIMYGVGILNTNILKIKMAFLRGILSPKKIYNNAITKWNQKFSNYSDETKEKFKPFAKDYRKDANFDSPAAIVNGYVPPEVYRTYCTWFPPLPRDEKVSSDLATANVNAKIWSKQHARIVQGMSERESLLMQEDINSEFSEFSKLQQEFSPKPQFGADGKPVTVTNKFDKKSKTGLEKDEDIKAEKNLQKRETK
jgi:hypothetical protein